jgi:hypothetical protein
VRHRDQKRFEALGLAHLVAEDALPQFEKHVVDVIFQIVVSQLAPQDGAAVMIREAV